MSVTSSFVCGCEDCSEWRRIRNIPRLTTREFLAKHQGEIDFEHGGHPTRVHRPAGTWERKDGNELMKPAEPFDGLTP